MGFFQSPEEVDKYIGEMFRVAADHPEVGPKMKAARLHMQVHYSEPDCELNVRFHEPMEVQMGPSTQPPDIVLRMKADTADKFWRGKYNLAVGLAQAWMKQQHPVKEVA